MRLDVVHQVVACQGANVLGRAQNGSAQGAVLECSCMQVVKDDLLSNTLHLQYQARCKRSQ